MPTGIILSTCIFVPVLVSILVLLDDAYRPERRGLTDWYYSWVSILVLLDDAYRLDSAVIF